MFQMLVPYLVPAIEISIISAVLYYLLSFFWNTRAMDLALGVVVFLTLFLIVSWLHFPVLQRLMHSFVSVSMIAMLIIFQPELRLALSKLSVKGKKYEKLTEFDRFLEGLTNSVYRFSEKRIGALILLENQDTLDEFATRAIMLNSQFSSELLESLFLSSSPLHDGAVIIRGTTILAAAAILPLADDSSQISRAMGTRHRAALGITQLTDALSIVISEETGKVSIARDGIMTRGVKMDRFKGILRSIFNPPKSEIVAKFSLQEWLKSWKEM
ncbi:MAG: TIGR00159 family protein [Verrucomicrobia bacterium]|nr:TIGR00159 family protein [Verrucomicrobiota bacterium]